MHIIKATSPTDAWLQSHRYLLDNGNKDVMNESINMTVEIEDNFDIDERGSVADIIRAENGIVEVQDSGVDEIDTL